MIISEKSGNPELQIVLEKKFHNKQNPINSIYVIFNKYCKVNIFVIFVSRLYL